MLIDHSSLKDNCIRIFHNNIELEMRILLTSNQTLPDYYYIFGYNISGWDHPTENVITENVIHSKKPVYPKGWENTD